MFTIEVFTVRPLWQPHLYDKVDSAIVDDDDSDDNYENTMLLIVVDQFKRGIVCYKRQMRTLFVMSKCNSLQHDYL